MKKNRQLFTEDDLYAAAVEALARRAHSVFEMRRYLQRRAAGDAPVSRVMERLEAAGLVDDSRYARQFARARSANRRQGRFRIARELRVRGVADRHIDAALAELSAQIDEAALVRRAVENWLKKHRVADPASLDRNRTASLYRSLIRAGFSADSIRTQLRKIGQAAESLPDIEGPL